MKIVNNDFDNSTIVIQPPVLANRPSLTTGDAWHELGFEWISTTPDIIYLNVASGSQILNIYEVAFIADDKNIQEIKLSSNSTNFNLTTGQPFSMSKSQRGFSIPIDEFRKMASAHIVKMKVVRDKDFSLSRFGKDYPDVTVSRKMPYFLAKVDELRAGIVKVDTSTK